MPYRSSLCLMTQLVRDGDISPVELMEAHLRQIDSVNPRINAFMSVFHEEARREAARAESSVTKGEPPGLLHGVPVTIKDSFDVAGQPTLSGSKFRLGHKASRDAFAVRRLRDAGAIIIGKTSTPEFVGNYETDNHLIGRTNNPWDLNRTPGGSSGGEGAAIASCCSPAGLASDGGGSIRIPAHFCGIAGIKPTAGRISAAGHYPQFGHPAGLLGVSGVMARTARDLRLLFSVLAGQDYEDTFSAPVPLRVPDLNGLKIGCWDQVLDVPFQPGILETVAKAATALEEMGIPVEPWKPRGLQRAPDTWFFFFAQLTAPIAQNLIRGRESDAHWTGMEFVEQASAKRPPTVMETIYNLAARDSMRTHLFRQMEEFPVLLTPVCGSVAFPHRDRSFDLLKIMQPVTIFNLLAMPAVVIPYGMSPEGLPIGIQLVARPYEEELLLEIATRLEELRGPFPLPKLP